MLTPILRTARTTLRPFRKGDEHDVLSYATDPAYARHVPVIPQPYARSDAEQFVASQIGLDPTKQVSYAIEFQGRVVGGVNLRFYHEGRVAGIGYGIARRLWSRGLTTEAARAAIDEAFRSCTGLVRAFATADARNVGSVRVMEKLGMQREGCLRKQRLSRGELVDEIIYGVLRDEWNG